MTRGERRRGRSESKCIVNKTATETKNRSSLWKCRRPIVRRGTRFLPLSGIQLASPTRPRRGRESFEGRRTHESTYATSRDLTISVPFFRSSRKSKQSQRNWNRVLLIRHSYRCSCGWIAEDLIFDKSKRS